MCCLHWSLQCLTCKSLPGELYHTGMSSILLSATADRQHHAPMMPREKGVLTLFPPS
jgi:hypothetical protein